MSNDQSSPLPDPAAARRWRPALLVLCAASGCAALIYEIVWLQLLQLVIGSSAISLGLLLGSFMGGMCLGSLALSRLVAPGPHPLRVYAFLELGIGALGLMVLFGMPWVGRFYGPHAGHGLAGILLRGVVGAGCLLAPAALMGATFPAISRWVETTPRGVRWLGFFYGANIAGAVSGCLLAGFYLLRVYDMATATYVAAAINGTVALAGLALAARTRDSAPAPHPKAETDRPRGEEIKIRIKSKSKMQQDAKAEPDGRTSHRAVCVAIGLSGLCALSAEVVWTRLLALLLGGTVYAFSIILAVFLFGLGIGSLMGSLLARRTARAQVLLGLCQMLLVPAMAWTAYMVSRSLPNWPVNPALAWGPWFAFQLDLVRCLWAILPATMLWGASFPLALAAACGAGEDPAQLVGRVYAANTVGAIIGSIASSLLLIPWLGTQNTQRLLMALSAGGALLMWMPWRGARFQISNFKSQIAEKDESAPLPVGSLESCSRRRKEADRPDQCAPSFRWLCLGPVLVVTLLMAWTVPPVPWRLIAHGRYVATYGMDRKLLYVGEGMNASVAVTEMFDGVRNFHISGKIEASTTEQDMRLQRMLGHIPALLHSNAQSVLVVGCGAGVTAGSFVLYPQIRRIVICEIEPLIPKIVTTYFGKENYHVLDDPRVEVVYDDARHYILTTPETFDIITSDPIHPWVKGAATLYTQEYFELCRRHLKPGGLVTQWVPLYESNLPVVKSEMATFFSVFPRGTIWSNDENGEGYDTVLLGQPDDFKINSEELMDRMQQNGRVTQSLQLVGFHSFIGLLATYAGRGPDLRAWLGRAEINRDSGLRLQYLAGLGLNFDQASAIYQTLEAYRRYPEDLFTGTDQHLRMLRRIIEPGQKEPSNSKAPSQ